nr:MAG TPA: phosphoadenosine-phosphosulfate reductase [Caudoviricetes sp.]
MTFFYCAMIGKFPTTRWNVMSKQDCHVVSLSGGKDSTAMLLRMLEEKMPIDYIVFCDTGLEFSEMYQHLDRLESNIEIPITRVKADASFEYYFSKHHVERKNYKKFCDRFGAGYEGFGWPGPQQRWCTSRLKDTPRVRFLSNLRTKYNVMEYIGIAADEQYRLKRKRNQNKNHIHLLMEWNMTESDCLQYCYERGYKWGGLYEKFHRVSCWCCPLQSLKELRILWRDYPQLWEQLKE